MTSTRRRSMRTSRIPWDAFTRTASPGRKPSVTAPRALSADEALGAVTDGLRPGDAVLVKASHGIRLVLIERRLVDVIPAGRCHHSLLHRIRRGLPAHSSPQTTGRRKADQAGR